MRLVVVVIGVVWAAMPLLLFGSPAEDAVPYIVGGDIATDDPEQLYPEGGLTELGPDFRAGACELLGTPEACRASGTAFLSPPAAIPLAVAVASPSPDVGAAILRGVGCAAAAAALALAWRDLAGRGRRGPAAVAGAAVALTPLVGMMAGLGQTTALVLLAAAAGAPGAGPRGRLAVVAWGAVTALKAFPALAVVAVRRYAVPWILAAVAVIAVATGVGLAIAGTDRLGEFVAATARVAEEARSGRRSGGLESVAGIVVEGEAATTAVAWAMRLPLLWWLARGALRSDDGVRWAAGLLGAVLVVPQVWAHYLVVLPAVAHAVGRSHPPGVYLASALATVPATVLVAADVSGDALVLAVALPLVGTAIWAGSITTRNDTLAAAPALGRA